MPLFATRARIKLNYNGAAKVRGISSERQEKKALRWGAVLTINFDRQVKNTGSKIGRLTTCPAQPGQYANTTSQQ
ncbi:hypothetical protein [Photobacterium chitinilyticum]|uniref:Uncharacterized protein n=1 Tax=Photobacterium chitinilyticum TaxID=2485123 RepID=A0A3S3R686_9GAMM|nr:hypothetical protein [Photobacterium chitinilyticum]RWX53336.1 hypothetical protein EDI28_22240 [Photobacterium chitinilyticum]